MSAPSNLQEAADHARQLRSNVRQKQVLDAAAMLMESQGAQSVSVKEIADKAGVSVGLVYRYFGNKDDVVRNVIIGVLNQMPSEINGALESVTDPVRQIATAFEALCRVIDANRKGALLAYRETGSLDIETQELLKSLEISAAEPLLKATQAGVDQGLLRAIDPRLFAYNLMLHSHAWALKHWYFSSFLTLEEYIAAQRSQALSAVIHPEHRETYSDLI